ncbi:MAG TPA: glycosyltransferase family 2 protein [Chitinophagaceae bacterium]|nr:glycosyltransferase family 2 protein [Chitinophagaceae bacterium]
MLTVVCPVYNESKYIRNVLDFCVTALPAEKEIIFVDGASTDNTCDIISQYAGIYHNIQLIVNEKRIVPFALNKAIAKATGDIIIRLDAHTDYAPDYFEKIIETFNATNADIVGGPMRIAKGNVVQDAVGYATSTFFGVGNSSFHFEDFEGYTNTVYLGAWKKNIFSKTGLFDETLKRNQDDEFHYRAKSMGFTIYQSPQIKLYYHPRNTFGKLFKQYYQYGLYKPVVLKKILSGFSLRHLIPSLFVLYLFCMPFFALFNFTAAVIPLLLYILINLSFSFASRRGFMQCLCISCAYFILHFSYGLGFLIGLEKIAFGKK